MILGIDGKPLLMEKTGIGIYVDRLLMALSSLDRSSTIKVYLPFSMVQLGREARKYEDELRQQYGDQIKFVSSHFPPKLRRWIWQQSNLLPMELTIGDVDLFHATNLVLPPLKRAKAVLTLYDLTFALFPSFHVKGMQAIAREVKRSASRADGLIAISEHTKQDAIEQLGIPAERIRVTLLAADERYRVLDDQLAIQNVLSRYGIDREFIFYTGTLEPRKNVPTLVRAFHRFRQEAKAPHRLVIAGKKGWLYEQIFDEVKQLGLSGEVIFAGYVPDDDLPFLYNGATLFAYPSLYEGFGLPPLEAMACGCPVVTSNVSSLPEVVGDAGLMIDPQSADDLASALAKVVGDSELAARMRISGLVRAATFSWDRCGRETLSLYQDILGREHCFS